MHHENAINFQCERVRRVPWAAYTWNSVEKEARLQGRGEVSGSYRIASSGEETRLIGDRDLCAVCWNG